MPDGLQLHVYPNAARRILEDPGTARTVGRLALAAKQRARELVPVRTGTLRRSIYYEVDHDSRGFFAILSYRPRAYYGRFVELGTEKMPPHAFLRPAVSSRIEI